MDLFGTAEADNDVRQQPLAARMRPHSIDEVLGQDKILGPGKLLRRAIEADRLNSIILYGPPGCGKTSVGEVIATVTSRRFERTSGVVANVAELRSMIRIADHRLKQDGKATILFVDEIHRFNKAQQDVLLPHVENGVITLIGATTHNPLFFVNSPLTSRSLVFELKPLSEKAISELLMRAIKDERGLAAFNVRPEKEAINHLAHICEGDARRALNALEVGVLTTTPNDKGVVVFDLAVAEDSVQKKVVVYDHDEDGHYDTVSAFIKSVRGSDPHAAVYWLAKMLYAGEDPRFIARRLVILASEDIGNADPRGISIATAAMQAVEFVGMPEARITLSQATTYLATAPKSNASYLAINKAMKDVEKGRVLPVPEHLKNIKLKTAGAEENGNEYVYPHDYAEGYVQQEYVPTTATYYDPVDSGYEETIAKRMLHLKTLGKQRKTRHVA